MADIIPFDPTCGGTSGCPVSECDDIFSRITVDTLIEGGTRVSWELSDKFDDVGPYTFQLQVSLHGVETATDWVPVGATVVDQNYAIDDEKRVHGQTQFAHYRICLQSVEGDYFSKPIHAWQGLSARDGRIVREVIRQERLNFREGGIEGFFLKRKIFGDGCECLDFQTMEIRNPECSECYGTGFVGGYWPAATCVFAIVDPRTRHEQLDGGQARGTTNDIFTKGRMLAMPFMNEEDVWIDRRTDNRWFIHRIDNIVERRGVPVVANVELRHAPYSHPIYMFPRPDQ